jgi:type VI secretion system protein ImpG
MSDELLPYYHRELAFIRRLGAEFAEAHPKIAGRLRLGPDLAEDPHVERLIEAFAYLNARIRHKLDDDFPEISDALMGVLYPHYQAPIPAMAVVQFALDRGQGELTAGYTVPRHAMLETEAIDGEPCRFRTCYPTTLWPIALKAAGLSGRPFAAPRTIHSAAAQAVLRIGFECFGKGMTFGKLDLERLRLFIKGQSQHVFGLYELILNHTIGVALAGSPTDREPVVLDRRCLRPVGFGPDEGLLPYSARSFLGYRLLTEYFAFPQKFLFFDLAGLGRRVLQKAGNQLEVFLYLDRSHVDLEQNVTADTLQLGCTPVVNLYRQRAEPIALTHTETEYRVVPDARRPAAHEVYSIDAVTATSPDGQQVEYQPFFSCKHAAGRRQQQTFWAATRRPAGKAGEPAAGGSEVFLSLVDLNLDPSAPAGWTLDLETTCLNRDLPNRLPLVGGASAFRLSAGGPIDRIACLTGRPTKTLRPALKRGAVWRLISHLSLNHLSLSDAEDGVHALREILKLYDFADSEETRSVIEGLLSVRCRRAVGRVPGDVRGGFCRGIDVFVHLDETRFSGSGVFLFASVLERFLGLYCNLNSFSRLIATTNQREGELHRWPPRAGEMTLL